MQLSPATTEIYLRRAFGRMLEVADRLGDPRLNERPVGHDTNAVAALVVHCCGMADFWLGHVALGRASERNRDGEFSATASLADLHRLVDDTLARCLADVAQLEAGRGTDAGGRQFLPGGDTSDAGVVLHVCEELYQHLGHMELTADVLTGS